MIDSYDKLTIKKYRELMGLKRDEYDDDLSYSMDIMSILSDKTIDELLEIPLDDFSDIASKSKFLYETIDRNGEVPKTLTINGKKYTVMKDAKQLCAGQYIDYKAYLSKGDVVDMLPYILTVFVVPEGCKYNSGYNVEELAEEFDNNITIPTALSIADFFLHQSKASMLSSLIYLKWMMKRKMKKEKNKEMMDQMRDCLEQIESLESLIRISDGWTQQSK